MHDAYKQGRQAWRDGLKIEDCPYSMDDWDRRYWWREGFREAYL